MARRRKKRTTTESTSSSLGGGPAVEQNIQPAPSNKTISELGAKDSDSRISKYRKWIDQSMEAQVEFQDAYVCSMKMLANDPEGHYEDAALAELHRAGRPALIINQVTPTVMTVCGLQRRTRELAKFLPQDPDDAGAVELLEHLYRWHYDQTGLRDVDSDVFLKKYAGGIGFWKLSLDTSVDPRGRVKVQSRPPTSILWDPNFPDAPWTDVEYVIDAEWHTIDAALDAWPEHEEAIRKLTGEWLRYSTTGRDGESLGDTQAPHRYFWDPETQRVRIAQVWYKRTKTAKIAVFSDGEVESDKDKVAVYEEALKEDAELAARLTIVRHPVVTCWMAHVLDDIELDHRVSPLPFNDLPIEPSVGYNFWKRPVGAVEYMRDPQREKNKRRSTITEIASRAAHSGFYNKKGTGATREDIELYSSGAGAYIEFEQDKPERIEPPVLPQYLVYLDQQAGADIPKTVNVNDELLGQTSAQTTSGRAIENRQRGALLTQEFFFDTFASDQAKVAKRMVAMIRNQMTIDEAVRVLGAHARRTDNEELQAQLADTTPEDLETLMSDAFSVEFDVVVTTQPWDPSGKVAAVRTVSDLMQAVPMLAAAAPDFAIEMAIQAGLVPKTMGDRYLQRVREMLQAAQQPQQQGGQPALEQGGGAPPVVGEGPPIDINTLIQSG